MNNYPPAGDKTSAPRLPAAGKIIPIAAALVCRPDGRTVLVRKHGTTAFMQPGGKIEPGESPLAALVRELREELDLAVNPNDLVYLGSFTASAANEPDCLVQAEVFRLEINAADNSAIKSAGEIAEMIWIDPAAPGEINLAPLTRDHVLRLHGAK